VKFFWYSVKGYSLSLAQRLQSEGNRVRWYQEQHNEKTKGTVGEGLVPVVKTFAPEADEVVVFDFTGAGKKADELRRRGNAVLGGSVFADALEKNRMYATQLMKAAGLKVPASIEYGSLKEGIEFVKAHPNPLVFKPEGDFPSWMTMVGDDNESLAKDMERVARMHGDKIKFQLQEKVKGTEVSIEGWFNGDDWIYHSINSTLEEKRLLTGSLGPNTGCMGNVVFFYRHARPSLAKQTLFKLTPFLKRVGYVGPIDVNTKGGYALEFTPRFGYDAVEAMIELLDMEWGKTLADCARGQANQWKVSFDYSVGVTMSVPPFPSHNEDETAKSYGEVVRMPKELWPHFYMGDVMLDEDGDVISAGNDGVVGVMTAVGSTVAAAQKLCYDRVKEVSVPNVQYRLDIGDRALKEIPQLLREVSSEKDSAA
jgi:phosphoribosylamine--glycine ligase